MKTIRIKPIFQAVLLIVALVVAFPVSAKNKAQINFNETVYDFGQISLKKGKVSHEFTFTNSGDKNLVITDARADCGCTRPEYSDAPVASGKSGTIKVTFGPAAKGHFTKKVTITTNGNPRKVRLLIKGEVVE
ncbi:MAG: DUF1573 domain-containing protein [Muribaculaceae bacterium]|nr:DUF1573 domain-containing protein [Muribaculaceae bacterium]